MTNSEAAQTTALYDQHVALGAKMTDFGGWMMPLEYSGVIAEHTAVRTSVGAFDVSHMCAIRVHGAGAKAFLNSVLTNDLMSRGPGEVQYSLLCAEDGGIVDDLLVYAGSDDECHIIANAGNGVTVVEVLAGLAPAGVEVEDRRPASAIIAVQGPKSREVVRAAGFDVDLAYMTSTVVSHNEWGFVVVSRTGYTGEHGYEIVCPREHAGQVWNAVLAHGAVPCGLGARDTLRLEMGYPLHGNDISLEINPVMARLGWAVGWKKSSFRGKAALDAQKAAGAPQLLRGIDLSDRGVPRSHMKVLAGDVIVGETTSGGFSPTLQRGIALALLSPSVAVGDAVAIDVRGRLLAGTVVNPPFVSASPKD